MSYSVATRSLAEAERDARRVVNGWVGIAAGVGMLPGSTLLLGAADVKIVKDVAKAFGVHSYSMEEVTAMIAATVTGKAASELLTAIPIAGWIIKGCVSAGVTKAAGEALIEYFREKSSYT